MTGIFLSIKRDSHRLKKTVCMCDLWKERFFRWCWVSPSQSWLFNMRIWNYISTVYRGNWYVCLYFTSGGLLEKSWGVAVFLPGQNRSSRKCLDRGPSHKTHCWSRRSYPSIRQKVSWATPVGWLIDLECQILTFYHGYLRCWKFVYVVFLDLPFLYRHKPWSLTAMTSRSCQPKRKITTMIGLGCMRIIQYHSMTPLRLSFGYGSRPLLEDLKAVSVGVDATSRQHNASLLRLRPRGQAWNFHSAWSDDLCMTKRYVSQYVSMVVCPSHWALFHIFGIEELWNIRVSTWYDLTTKFEWVFRIFKVSSLPTILLFSQV